MTSSADVIKEVEKIYENSLRVPLCKSAQIRVADCENVIIDSTWTQTSFLLETKLEFQKTLIYRVNENGSLSLHHESNSSPILSSILETIEKQKGETKVMIQKVKSGREKNNSFEKDCIFIFENGNMVNEINLSDVCENIHGDVYYDSEIGSVDFCLNKENKHLNIVYIAEEKRSKHLPFFSKRLKNGDENEENTKSTPTGTSQYIDDFGEQMSGKCQSVIVKLELDENMTTLLSSDLILTHEFREKRISPGNVLCRPIYGLSMIYGIAFVKESIPPLGLVYCTNRPSFVFRVNLDGSNFERLSSENRSVRSIRLSDDGHSLIWLERKLKSERLDRKIEPGPHMSFMDVVHVDLSSETDDPIKNVTIKESAVCLTKLPDRPFLNNSNSLFFASTVRKHDVLSIPFRKEEGGIIEEMQQVLSGTVLDTLNGFVLLNDSKQDEGPTLKIFKCNMKQSIDSDTYLPVISKPIFFDEIGKYSNKKCDFSKELKVEQLENGFIVYATSDSDGKLKKKPLIVWPHGGPHTVSTTSFSTDVLFFCRLGFVALFVNFSGSIGVDENYVEKLLGNVGEMDVTDCKKAVDETIREHRDKIDSDKVVLLGGSHGGFLVTHLAGQYPKMFKAMCARNPVINIARMNCTSDIPDWTYNECGISYAPNSLANVIDTEIYARMLSKSPISHAHKIEVPVRIFLGLKDSRVPPDQGMELYKALKGKDCNFDVKVYRYDDCHSLSKIDVHSDVFMNVALFFIDELNLEIV